MPSSKAKSEKGAIVLESTYVIFFAIIVLCFFLSYGFLLYQKAMLHIMTNEVAEEITQSYKFGQEDGDLVTQDMVTNLGRYRYVKNGGQLQSSNQSLGTTMLNPRLSGGSLAIDKGGLSIKIEPETSDLGRIHYKLTVTKNYKFLFDDFMNRVLSSGDNYKPINQVEAVSIVEGMDASFYINASKVGKWIMAKTENAFGIVDSVINSVNNMASMLGL